MKIAFQNFLQVKSHLNLSTKKLCQETVKGQFHVKKSGAKTSIFPQRDNTDSINFEDNFSFLDSFQPIDEFWLFFTCSRLGLFEHDLAFRFSISEQVVSDLTITWVITYT